MHDDTHNHHHHPTPPAAPPIPCAPFVRWLRHRATAIGWLVLAAWILSGVYFVAADEEAVIRRFGRALASTAPPGVHVGFPWPVDRIQRVKVRESKRVAVGFRIPDLTLGRQPAAEETQFFTGDHNIVDIQMMVQYMVQDPVDFLYRTPDVERLVARAAETALTAFIARANIDDILTTGRSRLQQAVYAETQAELNALQAGVQVVSVDLRQAAPPPEVADAFRDVASARGDRDRIINEAQGYMNDNLPRARGESQRLRLTAEAWRRNRIDAATGEADRFVNLHNAYTGAKETTARRLYLEAMEDILPRLKILIVDSDQENLGIGFIQEAP